LPPDVRVANRGLEFQPKRLYETDLTPKMSSVHGALQWSSKIQGTDRARKMFLPCGSANYALEMLGMDLPIGNNRNLMVKSSIAESTVSRGPVQDLNTAGAGGRRKQVNAVEVQPATDGLESHAARTPTVQRYAPLTVWAVVILTLLFISLRIIGSGFLPGGDARRHVAKAFTEKPYTETVVMRPEYTMDHSPGWEWLLGLLHRVAGWDTDALMSFSIIATLLCVFLAPLPWLRRPEAWLAALLAQMVAIPELMNRLTQARPYLLTEGILIGLLLAWSKEGPEKPSRLKIVLTSLALALSVWVHGAWYLWVLPLAAFFLAGRWRTGLWLTTCWIAGTAGGAVLTGKPIEFLKQAVLIALAVSREQIPQWILVGEFRPSYGEFSTLAMVMIVSLYRNQQDRHAKNPLQGPIFWLIAICWILGFKADRFWADWGVPAVLVWLALQFQELMTRAWETTSWKRAMAVSLLAVPLFWHSTNDLDRRYTGSLSEVFVDAKQPALQGWLPEPRGVFYTAHMEFFYNTFYKNPQAEWRYILGMEPALMPDSDLGIFRLIQMSQYSFKAYEPWIQKMHPGDRMEIPCASQPNLPQLEWTNAVAGIWIGRLPKPN
jgi:hypothetical protein